MAQEFDSTTAGGPFLRSGEGRWNREGEGRLMPLKFMPIVTTFSVTSSRLPLEKCLNDPDLLSAAFLDYRERVGLECFPIMWDSHFTAEAFGCTLGFTEREAVVQHPLAFPSGGEVNSFYVPEINASPRVQCMLEAVKKVSRCASESPVIANTTAPFTAATKIFGVENLLIKLYDEPDQVKLVLRKIADFIKAYSDQLVESGATVLFVGEPMGSPEIISPLMFREFVFPELKRIVSFSRAPSILHICGNVYPILREMVDIGADLLSVDQRVELKRVREIVGWEVLLGGNLDPVEVLLKGTPETVTQAARRCYQEAGPQRLVLMPGCTILPETPVENIRAMIQVTREWSNEDA